MDLKNGIEKLMFLTVSHVFPCSLEVDEGVKLDKAREKEKGRCPDTCPFKWYCKIIVDAIWSFTQDFAELTAGLKILVDAASKEELNANVRLVIRAIEKQEDLPQL